MLLIHSWNRFCAYMHTFFLIPLQSRNIATLQCKFKFILILIISYFVGISKTLFWRSRLSNTLCIFFSLCEIPILFFFSELKADAPACAPSLSSAGIPFKGAVWLLLYNLLEVSFPKCRSCHAFGIPAEFCVFLQNCGLNAGYSDSLLTWVWVGIKHISSLCSQQWMTHHALLWIQHVAWKCQVTCHAGETLMW